MNKLLDFDASQFKDISREPKVRRRDEPREVTHTITMIPPNYLNTPLGRGKASVGKGG